MIKELNFSIRNAVNEPIKDYLDESPEKISLKQKISELKSKTIDIPIIINGQEIRTNDLGKCVIPHNHNHVLATYHKQEKEVEFAINSLKAWMIGLIHL